MSELLFYFHAPTPKYFRDNGFFKNPKNLAFVCWCFERCSNEERTVPYDGQMIKLEPYQFIFGRKTCGEETGLTEDEIRTQQKRWENYGFLKKAPNKTPNRFTIYEWVLTPFLKVDPQLKTQVTPKRPPSNPHNQEEKKKRSKESHPSIPSGRDDGKTDDFSSNIEKEEDKIEIYQGIFLTKSELDDCIKIKGDIDKVKHAIEFIQTSKKRKHPITNWPNALAKWKIENKAQVTIEDNIAYAEKLCKAYPEFVNGNGWRCYMYTDKKKDQRGILFESQSAYQEGIFVALIDGQFQQKCFDILRVKRILKESKQA